MFLFYYFFSISVQMLEIAWILFKFLALDLCLQLNFICVFYCYVPQVHSKSINSWQFEIYCCKCFILFSTRISCKFPATSYSKGVLFEREKNNQSVNCTMKHFTINSAQLNCTFIHLLLLHSFTFYILYKSLYFFNYYFYTCYCTSSLGQFLFQDYIVNLKRKT